MQPRFTDSFRFRRGYVRADETDVAKTWAAARKKLAQDKAAAPGTNVIPLPGESRHARRS
jgi:hypothetical protein